MLGRHRNPGESRDEEPEAGSPPPRDDVDGNRMGEAEDRVERWRQWVRDHPDLATHAERLAAEDNDT